MSDAFPYPTRLRYAAGYGIARCDGVQTELRRRAPSIGIAELTEIDFIPNIVCQVRQGCGQLRDMDQDERFRALVMLERMAAAAREALDGGNGLTAAIGRRA